MLLIGLYFLFLSFLYWIFLSKYLSFRTVFYDTHTYQKVSKIMLTLLIISSLIGLGLIWYGIEKQKKTEINKLQDISKSYY